ncbi:MAG TPA: hypothetical protein VGJ86_06275 [Acidimicrobiales bacterium]|jgi:hypothetical protein
MRRALLVPVLSMLLVGALAACGDDDDKTDSTTTTSDGSTTTSDGSTTTTAASGDLSAGPNYVETSGPSGMGCTPGDVTTLPTGWWAGEIKKVEESYVDFDVVCWYQGAAATAAAAAAGQEATDDYWVQNDDPKTYKVEFPLGMTAATCVGLSGPAQPFACEGNDVLDLYRQDIEGGGGGSVTTMVGDETVPAFPTVWIHSNGQIGDYIYMQFTP